MAEKDPVRELRELVEDIETAMMTTRRADGHLVSRPMALQAGAAGADFMTVDKPQPVVLFEVLKGMVTGKAPDIGEVHKVSGAIRGRS
jgi:hypothetical protein